MLEQAGFKDIKITLNNLTFKDNHKQITESLDDANLDDYVASAIIEARKPDYCCSGKC